MGDESYFGKEKCMTGDLRGVNETKIDALVNEINDSASRIFEKLNYIEENVESVKYYFKCDQATEFFNKFNDITSNFSIVRDNLLSIGQDFVNVKKRYSSVGTDIIKAKSAEIRK